MITEKRSSLPRALALAREEVEVISYQRHRNLLMSWQDRGECACFDHGYAISRELQK